MVLGRRVRAAREQLGLTMREAAQLSKLSPRFLSEVEAGRGNISVLKLQALADAFDVPLTSLLVDSSATPVRPVALLGLRGAGKTTVGRGLARRLKWPFLELDTRIAERAGMALGELFSLYGEEYYRELERTTLSEVLAEPGPRVIATGGGLVTEPETWSLLRRHALTVWLKARPSEYWTRVMRQGDRRPTTYPQAREALRELVTRRDPLYRQADVTIDTSGLTVADTVRRVLDAIEKKSPDPPLA